MKLAVLLARIRKKFGIFRDARKNIAAYARKTQLRKRSRCAPSNFGPSIQRKKALSEDLREETTVFPSPTYYVSIFRTKYDHFYGAIVEISPTSSPRRRKIGAPRAAFSFEDVSISQAETAHRRRKNGAPPTVVFLFTWRIRKILKRPDNIFSQKKRKGYLSRLGRALEGYAKTRDSKIGIFGVRPAFRFSLIIFRENITPKKAATQR